MVPDTARHITESGPIVCDHFELIDNKHSGTTLTHFVRYVDVTLDGSFEVQRIGEYTNQDTDDEFALVVPIEETEIRSGPTRIYCTDSWSYFIGVDFESFTEWKFTDIYLSKE
jgi:hypothetical protein